MAFDRPGAKCANGDNEPGSADAEAFLAKRPSEIDILGLEGRTGVLERFEREIQTVRSESGLDVSEQHRNEAYENDDQRTPIPVLETGQLLIKLGIERIELLIKLGIERMVACS